MDCERERERERERDAVDSQSNIEIFHPSFINSGVMIIV